MTTASIPQLITKQRNFFKTGATRSVASRKEKLTALEKAITSHEEEILAALRSDLGKSPDEAVMTELHEVLSEIRYHRRKLSRWIKERYVPTPLTQFGSRSRIQPEPLGTVLIIGPWNFPFNLVIMPLIGAISGGNTAILKPSELSPATGSVIKKVIQAAFPEEAVAVVEGGVPETQELLEHPFDHIFFTGGEVVGKIVMTAAAKHLTPVTLELGGKSPVIITDDADLTLAARRVAWGKFVNSGQICVAPDYVLIAKNQKEAFIGALISAIKDFFGSDIQGSPDYGRIINERHFHRLTNLLTDQTIAFGGQTDPETRFFSPTILTDVDPASPVMSEEIFGPVLPILPVESLEEAIRFVTKRPKPLALYVFTEDSRKEKRVLSQTSSGGVCVNNTLIHVASPHLPFGGVGTSGMGAYHGKASFDTFSHMKSVIKTTTRFDIPLHYPPYPTWFRKLLSFI